MRRAKHEAAPQWQAVVFLPEVDPGLRDELDKDPLIDEMVERLRAHLLDLVALDQWGRPVAWRTVVRVALGPALGRLREAQVASDADDVELPESVIVLPADPPAAQARRRGETRRD